MTTYILNGRKPTKKEQERENLAIFIIFGLGTVAFLIIWVYACIMFYFF